MKKDKTNTNMHTKISSDNPYGYNRYGFAWEYVPRAADAHLDFGCNTGVFLNSLKDKQVRRLVGVDVCEGAVKKGRVLFPDLEIVKIREAASLPFDDGTFNSVTILDVLEHVYEQAQLLAELNRVLIDGGKLIVTVPGQHLFSLFRYRKSQISVSKIASVVLLSQAFARRIRISIRVKSRWSNWRHFSEETLA